MRSTDPDKRPRAARLHDRLRSRLSGERGSVLVEVMIGAVIVAIATVGILNGLDGAQKQGALNKARSVQSSLAQQDIERMRSMSISALSGLNQTRTVPVAGVNYTVVSTTQWVSDRNGLVNCSDTNAQAEYLKLTSTVTSPATTTKPVTETGLLTPTVGQLSQTTGSGTVKLTDRDGDPISGVTVALSGSSSRSAVTNALGCAVFGYIPTGTYTVTVNNYVEKDSVLPATDTLVVYPGRASFGQIQVDRPASIRATFVPPVNQTFTTSMVWDRITVKNANLPGSSKLFTRGSRATTVDAASLFPYSDGVGVYAGDCPANDPSLYAPNYFVPPTTRGWVALDPGDLLKAVSVEMPTVRVTINRQAISSVVPSWTNTQLMVTEADTGCTDVIHTLSNDRAAATSNVTFDIAQPFGRYTFCASTTGRTSGTSGSTGQTPVTRKVTAAVNMTNVPPTKDRALTMTTTAAVSGNCP